MKSAAVAVLCLIVLLPAAAPAVASAASAEAATISAARPASEAARAAKTTASAEATAVTASVAASIPTPAATIPLSAAHFSNHFPLPSHSAPLALLRRIVVVASPPIVILRAGRVRLDARKNRCERPLHGRSIGNLQRHHLCGFWRVGSRLIEVLDQKFDLVE